MRNKALFNSVSELSINYYYEEDISGLSSWDRKQLENSFQNAAIDTYFSMLPDKAFFPQREEVSESGNHIYDLGIVVVAAGPPPRPPSPRISVTPLVVFMPEMLASQKEQRPYIEQALKYLL